MIFILTVVIAILFLGLFIHWIMPDWTGRLGEEFVSRKLHGLDPAHYKILGNLMLPSKGNTSSTQIDFVVISNYGIFCIEVKTYKGWIFGNAKHEAWTQVIFRYKKKFYNPLLQNYAHIKAITDLLGPYHLKAQIVSLVVFTTADRLQISGTDSVGYLCGIVDKIKNFTTVMYSDLERDEIYDLLLRSDITDKKARKSHDKEVREIKKY